MTIIPIRNVVILIFLLLAAALTGGCASNKIDTRPENPEYQRIAAAFITSWESKFGSLPDDVKKRIREDVTCEWTSSPIPVLDRNGNSRQVVGLARGVNYITVYTGLDPAQSWQKPDLVWARTAHELVHVTLWIVYGNPASAHQNDPSGHWTAAHDEIEQMVRSQWQP